MSIKTTMYCEPNPANPNIRILTNMRDVIQKNAIIHIPHQSQTHSYPAHLKYIPYGFLILGMSQCNVNVLALDQCGYYFSKTG